VAHEVAQAAALATPLTTALHLPCVSNEHTYMHACSHVSHTVHGPGSMNMNKRTVHGPKSMGASSGHSSCCAGLLA
jgi:hypothetical protein